MNASDRVSFYGKEPGLPNFCNWDGTENAEMITKPKKYNRRLIFLSVLLSIENLSHNFSNGFSVILQVAWFLLKKGNIYKALQYEKMPFLYSLFTNWIANDNKHAGTKSEKPGGKQWL